MIFPFYSLSKEFFVYWDGSERKEVYVFSFEQVPVGKGCAEESKCEKPRKDTKVE